MKSKFTVFIFLALCSLVRGNDVNVSVDIHLGKVLPPPPPEVIVITPGPQSGPPPWAPAHGNRRKHGYYYYPGADVYFRPEDRVWFYLEGGEWRFGTSLPTNIRVDFDHSVSLSMETDRPYNFHNDVKVSYPADYFVTKVKVKEKRPKPDHEKPSPSHADGDSPERGKGKGKGKNK